MNIDSILTSKGSSVITIAPGENIAAAARLLAKHHIGAVPVLDGGKICGMISERDIVQEISEHGQEGLNKPVAHCMTKRVVSCLCQDTVDHVMGLMTRGKFRHIPVMENQKLTGIISIGDVVKCKIEQSEREVEDMRTYISAS